MIAPAVVEAARASAGREGAAVRVANQSVAPGANYLLPPALAVSKTVANPEVATVLPRGAKRDEGDDLLGDLTRGKSSGVTEIGKGWRLETNTDGRLRWRWQVKDDAGNPITYVKSDGETGYKRGSQYVGITQREEAQEHDRKRVKGKHKPRRSRKARG